MLMFQFHDVVDDDVILVILLLMLMFQLHDVDDVDVIPASCC
jgi:hypothetical protein